MVCNITFILQRVETSNRVFSHEAIPTRIVQKLWRGLGRRRSQELANAWASIRVLCVEGYCAKSAEGS
jgi:hypothetical protein